MNRDKLIELIDSNGRFNLPTVELELLADHLIANGIGDVTAENAKWDILCNKFGEIIANDKDCENGCYSEALRIINEVKQYSGEYDELKHLAETAEQLENYVQLPCGVGDTVYYIREAISKNPYEPKIEVGTVLKIIVTKSGLRLALSMNSVYENSTNSIGKSIFFDEQEAEARLKELQGEVE